MTDVGQLERKTQNRLRKLLESLGYEYLGNWEERPNNRNVEEEILSEWLKKRGIPEREIAKVLFEVNKAISIGGSKTLYDANREFYSLLRYGVKITPETGQQKKTVWLVDWENPENNHFAVAEEVTVAGNFQKRPDLVLYVNGVALGLIELKRSIVSVSEGIRQNLDNQKKQFIESFFATSQILMAGNDTEGLRYGVIKTPEKHYLEWKEPSQVANKLDAAVTQLGSKERLLELVHDFIVFDAGTKKICRHNQYFGVKAAQERLRQRNGGIIWHTQGSGKSLTMVWLAKWIWENVPDARVLVITDRKELDKQIEDVFKGIGEKIHRTRSGKDFFAVLSQPDKWLVCSLMQKFGTSEEGDVDAYLKELQGNVPKGFKPKGNLFVFVDECHRTQSGKLHEAMQAILPDALFVGFTGTPLLKKDKKSIEVFGSYIHTYRYDEAVRDGVVLDLRYEARRIDQELSSPRKVDEWFEAKTRGLTDVAKAQLKKRWGTMQKVLSSKDRLERIVADIVLDMEREDRLLSGKGNALLVSGDIYQACRFYEMFQKTPLAGKCAIVTSYRPSHADIKGEESGEGETQSIHQYEIYRKMLAEWFQESPDKAINKVDKFEDEVKAKFIDEPGQMKLLIVVDKLLTGFDAPPATFLYIDKKMQNHGLFQAICRVNRLDTDDKEFGCIIDYKDLFESLEEAFESYTGGALDGYDPKDIEGLLKNRLATAKLRLDSVRETVKALCEPVGLEANSLDYIRFFCGEGKPDDLKNNEPRRVSFYKLVASYLRAFAQVASEMVEAGYSKKEAETIKIEVGHLENVRQEVKLASGDYIDLKLYEPAMRHLLDTYIRADESETVSEFEDKTLIQLIGESGKKALDKLPKAIRAKKEAVAEVVENNVRKVIIDEMAMNPRYYERMSKLLDELIESKRQEAIEYKEYLDRLLALASQLAKGEGAEGRPDSIKTAGQRVLYDNLDQDEKQALKVDEAIRHAMHGGWRGNKVKEREIFLAIKKALGGDAEHAMKIFEMVKKRHDY